MAVPGARVEQKLPQKGLPRASTKLQNQKPPFRGQGKWFLSVPDVETGLTRASAELGFTGEWPAGHKGRNRWGRGGKAAELEGWDKGDKRQRDRKREPAFSSEEGTPRSG